MAKTKSGNFKIKYKLLLIYGTIFLVTIIGINLTNYIFVKNTIEDMTFNELKNISKSLLITCKTSVDISIKNYLRGVAEKAKKLAEYYYGQYKLGRLPEREALNRLRTIVKDPQFGKIGKTGYLAGVSTQGVLSIHPTTSEGKSAIKFSFMKKAVAMKNGYIEYLWKNPGETKKRAKAGYLSYFKPWDLIMWASSYKAEFQYLVNINDIEFAINSIKIGKTGYAYLINKAGKALIHPSLKNKIIINMTSNDGKYIIKNIIKKKNGISKYVWKEKNKIRNKFAVYRHYPEMNWYIVATCYVDEINKPILLIRNISLGLALIFLLVMIPIIFINCVSITKPISKVSLGLKNIAESISKGEVDLTKRFTYTSHDEIGDLTNSLNIFFDKIEDVIYSLKNSSDEVSTSTNNLTNSVISSKEKTESIISSICNINNNLHTQNDVVIQTSSTINELLSSINSISKNVFEQSSAVEESSASIAEMATSINNVAKTANHANEISESLSAAAKEGGFAIQKAIDAIHDIEVSSNEITDIVKIITGIAEQTNLLAMNAAIEAAHAGSAGKGFAVVADEIRKLAESSASSAKEISILVRGITEKIKGTADLTNSAIEGLNNILKDVEQTSKINNEISSAMSEQSIGAGEILRSISILVTITEEVKRSIQAQKLGSEKISDIVVNLENITKGILDEIKSSNEDSSSIKLSIDEMNSISVKNMDVVQELEGIVNMFKTNHNAKGITLRKRD